MNKLSWEKFAPKFDESWHTKIRPFIESSECYDIYQQLKEIGQTKTIYPFSKDVWNAFRWTNYNNLKAVIIAQSPYHTSVEGVPVADGLCFSCSNTRQYSPSLEVLHNAISHDLEKKITAEPDWHYLAFQDVLLLNLSLTIEKGNKDSFNEHEILWRPFIKYLFEEVLSTCTGIPYMIFGSPAKEQIVPYLYDSQPYKCEKHPAWYCRDKSPMFTKIFSWANGILKENNNEEIYWDYDDYLSLGLPF